MIKFIFVTQTDRTAVRQGPSGSTYIINQGLPFKVKDPSDVEYFDGNKRFRRVGLLEFPKQKLQEEQEDLLKEELLKLFKEKYDEFEGKDIDNLVRLYVSKEHLVETLELGHDLDPSVDKKHTELLKSHFLSDMMKEEEKPKKPVKEPAKKPAKKKPKSKKSRGNKK